jgi:hypothetical protein
MGVEVRKFRRVPSNLKRMRYGVRPRQGIIRFYGLVTTMEGKKKRISFGVRVRERMLRYRRNLMSLIRATCNNILDKEVPVHKQGDIFSGFGELFEETKWVRVRKVHWYEAGVHYER